MEQPSLLQPGEQPQSTWHGLQPLLGCCIAFLVVDTVIVVLRFLTVLRLRKPRLALTWDDWFLVPGYLCLLAIIIIALVIWHLEVTTTEYAQDVILKPYPLEPILKGIFAIPLFTILAYYFTRMSILTLFLRLFETRPVRWTTWFLIAFVSAQTLAYFFAVIFICRPVEYFWTRASPDGELGLIKGTCRNPDTVYRAVTPPNIVTDILLIVTPIYEVWTLNSSRARKLGLTALFATGLACLIASAFRLWTYEAHSAQSIAPTLTNALLLWLVVEPSVYLAAACLLAMHPLLRLLLPRTWSRARAAARHPRHDLDRLVAHGSASLAEAEAPGAGDRLRRKTSRTDSASEPDAATAVEMEALGKAASRGEAPLDHQLRALTSGAGVLVTTEISVKEERIERVLGF